MFYIFYLLDLAIIPILMCIPNLKNCINLEECSYLTIQVCNNRRIAENILNMQ
jgi:hypothetical protein